MRKIDPLTFLSEKGQNHNGILFPASFLRMTWQTLTSGTHLLMKIVGSFVKYGRFVYRIELFSYGNRTLLSVFIIASWMGASRAKAGQTGASKGAEVDDACLSDVDLVSRRGSVVSLLG